LPCSLFAMKVFRLHANFSQGSGRGSLLGGRQKEVRASLSARPASWQRGACKGPLHRTHAAI